MFPFTIIAAVDDKFGIGKDGKLPWHLSADLQHFNRITTNGRDRGLVNIVVMGRKTWDSLPDKYKPLPNRVNWVISGNTKLVLPNGVRRFGTLNEALEEAEKNHDSSVTKVFIIGGELVFHSALQLPGCQKIYLTHIQQDFSCDTFFPDPNPNFEISAKSEIQKDQNLTFCFAEYIPKSV